MAVNLPPGWTAIPRPQPKELITRINNTFHDFLDSSTKHVKYEVEYAFIADGGYRRLLLVVLNEDQFPEQVEKGQTITLRDDASDGVVRYEIIGTINDAEIVMTCDDERFKTFFDNTGRKFVKDVVVQDLVGERVLEGLYGDVKAVQEERAEAKREKRERQKEVDHTDLVHRICGKC